MGLQKNRDLRRRLEERAQRSGYSDRVVFHGFAENMASALATAAVSVNLSKSESFSLTCLEAAQLGVPVVAFRSGGPEEIIVDGATGYLCELGDIAAVAGACRKLLADPPRARQMGKAAAAHVAKRFGAGQFVAQMRTLLDLEALDEQDSHASRQ